MHKQSLFPGFAVLIVLFCTLTGSRALAQAKAGQDSTYCMLFLTENRAFENYASMRIKASINALNTSMKNEILYLVVTSGSGVYKGISLVLDDSYKVSNVYRFTYSKQTGTNLSFGNWSGDSLNLKNLFIDSACYMNDLYRSGGTDELLIRRRSGVPVNGLIYKGCSGDPNAENSVHNKTLLQLLIWCRGKI
jgi:hypothetical protein